MSFLQPAMLLALPVIALPIVIHLINQRRFQTVHWAAMHFLLAANRMSRGYARLRQWLILAARTLAVAGLIFAISRPLSSGWLGLAGGGRVDTAIILLDRSPSMNQIGPGGISKLQTGISRLAESLDRLQANRYVLIESGRREPIELASPSVMKGMPETTPLSETADIPAMLETAAEYIRVNRPSRCELWLCSDVRRADWKSDSGRWDAIRSALADLPQMVRYHLLAYPEVAPDNRSIRVSRVRRVEGNRVPGNRVAGNQAEPSQGARLLISFRIEQTRSTDGTETIPVQLEIGGGRSEFPVEMTGNILEVQDHAVPIDGFQETGWGRLSIPSDTSPADNEYFFVYEKESVRQTLILTEQPVAVRPLEFAAAVAPSPDVRCEVEVASPDQAIGRQIDDIAVVVWQAAIPDPSDPISGVLNEFARRGGRLIFLPPDNPTDSAFAGVRWSRWSDSQASRVSTWVGDRDLLANTRSGEALPVGDLRIRRSCAPQGELTALATLEDGSPLLARAMTPGANVYFCGTTAREEDSSMATSGVVLYAMMHRAIEAGAQSLGSAQQFIAGAVAVENDGQWRQVAGPRDALSSDYARVAGVYQMGDRWFAINRSEEEDLQAVVPEERVSSLFAELDFSRVNDTVGNQRSLIREVWRVFLVIMLIALFVEAVLCLPRRIAKEKGVAFGGASG